MNALPVVLLLLFAGFTLINCAYYIYFSRFWIFSREPLPPSRTAFEGVSIICCIKNEAENLPRLLNALQSQDYPHYEILLANDHSSDNSLDLLHDFALRNPTCKIIDLDEEHGKKAGITKAISKAKYNALLFIDADCVPASRNWIELMTHQFSPEKQIVLGYGKYESVKNSVLNKLIRFETVFTALQYFAYAKAGNAYMGVGRNLAYTKKLFNRADGFKKHLHHRAGDDDLFVNENATRDNVAVCINPEAFTSSQPEKTWKSWLIQKRRHIGVSHLYKTKHQLQLGLFYTSQFAFYSLALAIVLTGFAGTEFLILLLFRELLVWGVISRALRRLREQKLVFYILMLEPFMISVQMLIFISTIVVKPQRWN